MKPKKKIIIFLILSISVNSFAQTESEKYDGIVVKLNRRYNIPDLVIPVIKAIDFHFQNYPEFLTDYKCLDNISVPNIQINITLISGTSWDLYNPPKQPKFLLFKALFKSNSKAFIDWVNYMQFLSISEAINGIPYDLIEKINSYWTFWNIENQEDVKTINIFDKTAKSIIQKGGTKCISIEYELVPDLIEEFKVVRTKIIDHSKNGM